MRNELKKTKEKERKKERKNETNTGRRKDRRTQTNSALFFPPLYLVLEYFFQCHEISHWNFLPFIVENTNSDR